MTNTVYISLEEYDFTPIPFRREEVGSGGIKLSNSLLGVEVQGTDLTETIKATAKVIKELKRGNTIGVNRG